MTGLWKVLWELIIFMSRDKTRHLPCLFEELYFLWKRLCDHVYPNCETVSKKTGNK